MAGVEMKKGNKTEIVETQAELDDLSTKGYKVGEKVDVDDLQAKVEDDGPLPAIDATDGAIKAAKQANLNLPDVTGTGPDGRITADDVQAHVAKIEEAGATPQAGGELKG